MKNFVGAAIVVLMVAGSLLIPSPPIQSVGISDFRAYWSASYLLTHGENFADPQQLLAVERLHTGWQENYPMVTWNPPWLLVILAPYALVPFERAVWWWMLTNIAFVITSAMMLWKLSISRTKAQRFAWIPVLIVFAYSITLTTIAAGQVNVLVLIGLSGFLFFEAMKREASAGAMLALPLVKPQLVYLVVPTLILDFVRQRRWRALAGFGGLLAALTAIVFILRPGFVGEYLATFGSGRLFDYQTPNLGGWLQMLFGWSWAKLMGLAFLPLTVIIWWHYSENLETRVLVDGGVILSLITAPFVWSYDFVVLLVPLMSVVGWIGDGKLPQLDSIAIAFALIVADAMIFYQRFTSEGGEAYFFWIPLCVAAVYLYVWWRVRRQMAYA